jgi:hypothetical protein
VLSLVKEARPRVSVLVEGLKRAVKEQTQTGQTSWRKKGQGG